ncbi:MAG: hypothetical protein C0498_01510 [Anaerolinea sp.]|nr:hypothetical protein [Anaerolinea sp.]
MSERIALASAVDAPPEPEPAPVPHLAEAAAALHDFDVLRLVCLRCGLRLMETFPAKPCNGPADLEARR